MKKLAVISILVLVGYFGVGSSFGVELPKDLNIVPPGPEVSASVAAFSGIWDSGPSVNSRRVFAIEKLSRDKASVMYAIEVPARLRSGRGGWKRFEGIIDGNSIVIKMPGRTLDNVPVTLTFTLKLKGENTLFLRIDGSDLPIEATLNRVKRPI